MTHMININGQEIERTSPEYITWLKEHRVILAEERKFQEFALSEADRLIKTGSRIDSLAHVPLLQDAVASILKSDPRTRQLGLFEE